MNDLISRKALLAEYDRVHVGPPGGARKLIENAPAVDEPHWATEQAYKNGYEAGKRDAVKYGRWEPRTDAIGFVRCSNCHDCNIYDDWADGKKWAYCPNCGAKMEVERCGT